MAYTMPTPPPVLFDEMKSGWNHLQV